MSYFDAVSAGFRNYFDFQGRATRPEFWWFVLFLFLLGLGTSVADMSFGWGGDDMAGPLSIVSSLGTLIPSISVGARRLHDMGRSGWWQIISFVPMMFAVVLSNDRQGLIALLLVVSLIGLIVLIYWWCQPTKHV